MATVVSARPAPLPQKIKRPPPPMVQTSVNGVKSSQSSPSPLLSSKRPPTGFKHLPSASATNGANGTVNGTGPRISNRRKDSQRPSDNPNRPPRNARLGPSDSAHNDRRSSKRMPEPYGALDSPCSKSRYTFVPILTCIHYSQNHRLYAQKVSEGSAFPNTALTSNTFSI